MDDTVPAALAHPCGTTELVTHTHTHTERERERERERTCGVCVVVALKVRDIADAAKRRVVTVEDCHVAAPAIPYEKTQNRNIDTQPETDTQRETEIHRKRDSQRGRGNNYWREGLHVVRDSLAPGGKQRRRQVGRPHDHAPLVDREAQRESQRVTETGRQAGRQADRNRQRGRERGPD